MKKIPEGIKLYDLSPSQATCSLTRYTAIHKSVMSVPSYLMVKQEIDFDLMKQAIKEEIARNDCMRLFYTKVDKKTKQYFLPEVEMPEIPVGDFTGKSEEEMFAWLKKDAATPFKEKKGETYRIKLFRAPDGRSGIYLNAYHVSMDVFAEAVFYRDLLEVYTALRDHTEMPKPLALYEECVQRELAKVTNQEKMQKHREFFEAYGKETARPFYAGIDAMRGLNKERKKRKDPELIYHSMFDPLGDKTSVYKAAIDPETLAEMNAFCNENGVALDHLLYLGTRTWLSKINGYPERVSENFTIHRRALLADKRCGGSQSTGIPVRTTIPESMTFTEAIKSVCNVTRDILRHLDFPLSEFLSIIAKADDRSLVFDPDGTTLSVIPFEALQLPEGWDCDFGAISTGRFGTRSYTAVLPNPSTGCLDFYYEYRVKDFKEEELRNLHENMVKAIKAGIADPQITIGKLMREVL